MSELPERSIFLPPPNTEVAQNEVPSGNLSFQQSEENRAKESITQEEQEIVNSFSGILDDENIRYDEYLTMHAMEIVNNIKGLEFETYEDWESHVDLVLAKIKS